MRPKALLSIAASALLLGCGGGGGKHSSASGSGLTFAANAIVFGVANGTGDDFSVDQLLLGSLPTTVVADVSGSILLFALDPHAASRYVLAADPTGAGTYGLYLSKSLTLTNATTLVAPGYSSVGSLAVTPDGSHVVYTATNATGSSELFAVTTSGGTPVDLGPADGSSVSPADGDTIAYVAPVGTSGVDEVFTRSLAAGASGPVRPITSDGANHALPAFSRDGTKLAYWTLASGANALFVDTLASGALATLPGVANVEPQGVAFSGDGGSLAFAGQQGTVNSLLTQPVDGSAGPTAYYNSTLLLGNYGLYWTDASGRVVGGMRAGRLGLAGAEAVVGVHARLRHPDDLA